MKRLLAPILLAMIAGATVALVAVLALGSGSGGSTPTVHATNASANNGSSAGTRREVASTGLTATQIYQQDSAGVVTIKAVTSEGEDSGTGIVLDDKGLILTNDHVVAGASSIAAGPGKSSNVTRAATLVGEEANKDLALIRIDPSGLGLHPLNLVSSGSTGVGFAIASNTVAQAIKAIEAGEGVASASASQDAVQTEGGSGGQSPYGGSSPYGSQSPYGEVESGAPGSEGGVEGSGPSGAVAPGEAGVGGPESAGGGEGQTIIVP